MGEMTESGDSSSSLKLRRRRWRRLCLAATLAVVILLAAVVAILAATVFRARDPTTEVLSARVDGVSPRVTFPAISFQLNVSLALEIRVHNPNAAAFSHDAGTAELFYRGSHVGEADVAPGKVPARGSEDVACQLALQADRLATGPGGLAGLIADVVAGEVAVDTRARVPGRIVFLGIFKHHAVAFSACHVVIGFPDLRIKSQDCSHRTVL